MMWVLLKISCRVLKVEEFQTSANIDQIYKWHTAACLFIHSVHYACWQLSMHTLSGLAVLWVCDLSLQPKHHQAHCLPEAKRGSPPVWAWADHLNAADASQCHHEMSTSWCHSNHTVREHGWHPCAVKNRHDKYSALGYAAQHCDHICCAESSHKPMHRRLSPSRKSCCQAQHVLSLMQP